MSADWSLNGIASLRCDQPNEHLEPQQKPTSFRKNRMVPAAPVACNFLPSCRPLNLYSYRFQNLASKNLACKLHVTRALSFYRHKAQPSRADPCGHLNSHQGKRPCPAPNNPGHDHRPFQIRNCQSVLSLWQNVPGTTRRTPTVRECLPAIPHESLRRLPSSSIRLLIRPHSQTSAFQSPVRP